MEKHVNNTSLETRDNAWVDLKEVKGLLYLLTHLSPRVCLDLREFELGVVGVHLTDLLSGRGAEDLGRAGWKNKTEHCLLNLNSYLFVGEDFNTQQLITLIISTS